MRDTMYSRGRIAALVACVAVGALIVAGCGGGGSTTSAGATGASGAAGSEPLSKDEFISQANAICADTNQKVQALQALPQNAQLSDAVPVLTQVLGLAKDSEAKLDALTPPAELQQERDKLVANAAKEQALAEKLITAAKANDASQFQSLTQQLDALDNQDNAIAKSIGLTECAKHVEPQG